MSPFHDITELKQIAQAKILMSQNYYEKGNVTKSFRCCSHKCLHCEAGAATLIDSY